MPRRLEPKLCACGCGVLTRGGSFLPGHAKRTLDAIVRVAGSVEKVREIVEQELGRKVDP